MSKPVDRNAVYREDLPDDESDPVVEESENASPDVGEEPIGEGPFAETTQGKRESFPLTDDFIKAKEKQRRQQEKAEEKAREEEEELPPAKTAAQVKKDSKPDPKDLIEQGFKVLGPYPDKRRGTAYFIMSRVSATGTTEKHTYDFDKDIYEELQELQNQFNKFAPPEKQVQARAPASEKKAAGDSEKMDADNPDTIWMRRVEPSKTLLRTVIDETDITTKMYFDAGRALTFAILQYSKVDPSEFASTVAKFNKPDQFKKFILEHLQNLLQGVEAVDEIQDLEGELELESQKRVAVEMALERTAMERDRNAMLLDVARQCMNKESLERFSMMLMAQAMGNGGMNSGRQQQFAMPSPPPRVDLGAGRISR